MFLPHSHCQKLCATGIQLLFLLANPTNWSVSVKLLKNLGRLMKSDLKRVNSLRCNLKKAFTGSKIFGPPKAHDPLCHLSICPVFPGDSWKSVESQNKAGVDGGQGPIWRNIDRWEETGPTEASCNPARAKAPEMNSLSHCRMRSHSAEKVMGSLGDSKLKQNQ